MSTLLWQKDGVAVDDAVQRFLAGEDVACDRHLFEHDLRATAAHVRGLGRIGVLAEPDVDRVVAALDALADDWRSGAFVLDDRFEDGHSAIEHALVERVGELGRRVHAGRSRNDQVQVALRLYMKAKLAEAEATLTRLARACLDRAAALEAVVMPGYTHLQRAVPSTAGHWMAGFAEAFTDDAELAALTAAWLDASPLGTAAGYGVNLPLDREGVARDLGFRRIVVNPQYVQNARGKAELAVLGVLEQALLDVRRFAWDVSLFTTSELGFVKLPSHLTTGSSIMPNKRNPDVVELLRAEYARLAGARTEIASVLSLPSGYQRDLQATKEPFLRGVTRALAALEITRGVVEGFAIEADRMRAAIDRDMYATDHAIELVASGMPFRDAYRLVADGAADAKARTPEASVAERVSPGAPGDLRLSEIERRLSALSGGARGR